MTSGESLGQRGLCLLASGLVLFLAASSWPSVTGAPTATARSCSINGTTYSSGQIFSLPGKSQCFKYICNDGSVSFKEGACEYNGVCRPVDSSFDVGCTTYTCNATKNAEGYTVYQTIITKTRCQDANGVCRDPGSTFPFKIGDQVYPNCGCTVSSNNSQVNYYCTA